MTSKKRRRVPELRFSGFTDDWEQRKLGDLVNIRSGFAGDAELHRGKYQVTRIETIADGTIDMSRVGFSNKKPGEMFLLHTGDILYSNINSVDHIGKTAIYSNDVGLYHGINLLRLVPHNGVDCQFLFHSLNTVPHRQWAMRHANRAVSQASINQSELGQQKFFIPTLFEQKSISALLLKLDIAIALHQRKQSLLKKLKQGYLQKLFPQKGEKKPALRFPEFTDDWEQCKLGNVVSIKNGYAFESKYFTDRPTKRIVLTPGSVLIGGGFQPNKGHYYASNAPISNAFVFKPLDLFVTMTDLTPTAEALGYPAFVPNDSNEYLHNQRLGKLFNFSGDIHFLYYVLSTANYHRAVVTGASGTTVKHTSVEKIESYNLTMPSITEQKTISHFFQQLELTLTLHQEEIDKLEQLKQGYLQKMFV